MKLESVKFARQLLHTPDGAKLEPHPTQQAIMQGISRWTTCVTGLQFDKSTVMAADAVWFATTRANRTVIAIGPSLEQSKIIFNEIAAYFRQAQLKFLADGKSKENLVTENRLMNGTGGMSSVLR